MWLPVGNRASSNSLVQPTTSRVAMNGTTFLTEQAVMVSP